VKPINNRKTQHLVALAKKGDGPAIDQLCMIYSERVRRIIRLRLDSKLRPKLDSVDVVQDALIMALEGLKDFTYRNEGDFLRWLSRIAENRLRDVSKKYHADKRDIRKEISFKQEGSRTDNWFCGAAEPFDATTPSIIMRKREALDRLEKALDMLKPEYKEVIVLKKIEGLSHAEIAEKLNKSENTVPMLLFRAMAALTIAYGED
jgi:RNA polymerase sigma-70 factor (ECF subfamily)